MNSTQKVKQDGNWEINRTDPAPIVSVIIPAYNHAKYILEALDSVLGQSFKDFEVIVVNDGSPDNTAEVLLPLRESGRIRYYEQPNGGQASARNHGLREARGEYIAYLDDDDLWPADKLGWQVEILRNDPELFVVYGKCGNVGAESICGADIELCPTGMIYEELSKGNPIRSPGQALIRMDALRNIGGFDVDIKGADDWDLWIRLAEKGRFEYDGRTALLYRTHDRNASSNYWTMYVNGMRVVRKHYGNVQDSEEQKRYRLAVTWLKSSLVGVYFDRSQSLKREGRIVEALRCILAAAVIDPVRVTRRLVKARIDKLRPESRSKRIAKPA